MFIFKQALNPIEGFNYGISDKYYINQFRFYSNFIVMKVESNFKGTAEPDHINGKNSSHRHSRNIRKKNKHR